MNYDSYDQWSLDFLGWLSLAGGNAANTASALARLGRSTKLISKAWIFGGDAHWFNGFYSIFFAVSYGFPQVSLNQFLGWWQRVSTIWRNRAQE